MGKQWQRGDKTCKMVHVRKRIEELRARLNAQYVVGDDNEDLQTLHEELDYLIHLVMSGK